LTFRGLVLQWFCIFADTTKGFGLWLRPAGAETLAGLLFWFNSRENYMLASKHKQAES